MNVMPYQIYRHFKGGLYFVLAVALSEEGLLPTVVYASLNGDGKVWTRRLSDFTSPAPEGKQNPTGQKNRFEPIKEIGDVLSNCTTENLIEELRSRPDSPLNEVDFEGLNSKVVLREFVLGELKNHHTDAGVESQLEPIMTADTVEEVHKFMENNFHRLSSRVKVFKSVIVEVESFD